MQDLGIRLKYTEQYCMSTTSLQVANKVYPLFVYKLIQVYSLLQAALGMYQRAHARNNQFVHMRAQIVG